MRHSIAIWLALICSAGVLHPPASAAPAGLAPSVTLSVDRRVPRGAVLMGISWDATDTFGTEPCTAFGGGDSDWSQLPALPPSDSRLIRAPTELGDYEFGLRCTGAGGSVGTATAVTTVFQAEGELTVDLQASTTRGAPGSLVELTWTSDLPPGDGCSLLGPQVGMTTVSQGRAFRALPNAEGMVEFTFSCINVLGLSGSDSVEILVTNGISAAPPTAMALPGSVDLAIGFPSASSRPSVNGDGSALAIQSTSPALRAILPDGSPHQDSNGVSDIYFRPAGADTAVLYSIDAEGPLTIATFDADLAASGAGASFAAADGQIRTFLDALGRADGITSSSANGDPGNAGSANPSIDAPAAQVGFDSAASNLIDGDSNGAMRDVFIKDLQTGSVTLVSASADGLAANGSSSRPSLSADGETVFFQTSADNLLPTDSGANASMAAQICGVRNPRGLGRSLGCVSISTVDGMVGNAESRNVKMSENGRFGVFESDASNLVAGDSNGASDIFWFEWDGDGHEAINLLRISTDKDGLQSNGASSDPAISGDGLVVTFLSAATNLDPPDNNGQVDAFIKYVSSGQIVRVDNTVDGNEPDGAAELPDISDDGSTIGFGSNANNLTPGDTDNSDDVFSVPSPQRLDPDEPGLVRAALPLPSSANPSCPGGYFVAVISDGPGTEIVPGSFGVELLLDEPGTRRLEGGLNFGGLMDAGQVGFAGVNIANPNGEAQRLDLQIGANPLDDAAGSVVVAVSIARQQPDGQLQEVFAEQAQVSRAQPLTRSLTVEPGYYVSTVLPAGETAAAGGDADGQFFFALNSSFVDRPGGGFQGGAVIGGFHAEVEAGVPSGFAAFCLGSAHSVSVRTLSQPSYGDAGARDLQLSVLDDQQSLIYAVPGR